MTRLKRVVTLQAGGTPTVDDSSCWTDDPEIGTAWVSIGDMTRSQVVIETSRRVTADGQAAKRLPVGEPGTVLFAMYASVGATAVLGTTATWNQAILGLTPRGDAADSRFVRYWLDHLRPRLSESFRSNTQDNLNADQVGSLPFPALSLADQGAMADFLDAETARIDALIAAKQRMIGIVGDRSKGTIEALLESSEIVVRFDGVPSGLRGDRRLARLAGVAAVQSGLTLDAGREVGADAVEVPYLRVANVQDGYIDTSIVKTVRVAQAQVGRFELRPGDVLMTEGGDPDKLGRGAVWDGAIAPCLHQNHVFAVRPDPSQLDPNYLAVVTRTAYARAYFETTATKTTGIASTSASKIAAFRVPVPPLVEQYRLAKRAQEALGMDRALTDTLTTQIALLRERRQALITAAVTGELAV